MSRPRRVLRSLGVPILWFAALLLWVGGQSAWALDPLHVEVKVGTPATLTFWNRPIVTLGAEIDGITPTERVARIQAKLHDLLTHRPGLKVTSSPGSLANVSGYWITVDGAQLFGLLPEDADSTTGETLEQLVPEVVSRFQEALDARRQQMHLPGILKGLALTAGATGLLALALVGIYRLHRRSFARVRPLSRRPLKVGGVNLAPFLRSLELGLIRATSFGLGIIAVYLWATYCFHLFPYTQPWGEGLARFFLSLLELLIHGAVSAVPGLFTVLVIFVLTRLFAQGLDNLLAAAERGATAISWLAPDTARATRRITQVLIWIFALSIAYPYIPGSDSDAFKGISVFLGFMISLGSAGLVNQVMSGLVVIYSRALKVGEYVKVGETEGTVTEVGLLSAKVSTPRREAVTVPNAVLVGSSIVNYSRLAGDDGSAVPTTVTIGYDTPWRQVHAMLELAAARTAGVRAQPAPVVLQRALSDYYVEYQLVVRIDRAEERIRILSALHAQIQDVFNEYGVQIMSPHFMAQPQQSVWVPKDQWYPAPALAPAASREAPASVLIPTAESVSETRATAELG